MGKKRIVKKTGDEPEAGVKKIHSVSSKKRVESGILHIEATYNNVKIVLTNKKGDVLCWSSSGSLGFKGAKKGTPFASAKVGEAIGLKGQAMGMKDVSVFIKGVGSGRESGIRN